VTHEADIALHAKRVVRLFDGKIASDEPVEKSGLKAQVAAMAQAQMKAVEHI
jgi:ABC-type lipoprotein export system ATPase subunit